VTESDHQFLAIALALNEAAEAAMCRIIVLSVGAHVRGTALLWIGGIFRSYCENKKNGTRLVNHNGASPALR
jgi:hypothetical protein